jgi:hypothetical protein
MAETYTPSKTIELALERFKLVAEAESMNRAESLDDLKFSVGEQWPLTIRNQRMIDGRPCLTMDQMQQSIRIVCNEYRQSRPSLNVNPVGSDSDVDTAEILQGIIRHIEVQSDAEQAYDWAHECVVRTGFGSWRILSDYADEDGNQEIYIEKIPNQFSVYWQPGVTQDKAKWAFITMDVPLTTYKDENPETYGSLSDLCSQGDVPPGWQNEEYVRVAEYFEVIEEKSKDKKPAKKRVVWRKINCFQVLEGGESGQELPGTSIPIFTATGDDIEVDGKRYLAGLVRNGKDAQRQYNYMISAATEACALAPKAPWIVVEGQLQGYEKLWESSNVRNFQTLTYKAVDVAGKPAPVPQRNSVEPPIAGFAQLIGQASLDLKASLGIYDPSLGQRKGDESGKAIEKLQQQGSLATLNYSDNVARTMRRFGKVLLEWIPKVYDTPRVMRIIKPDASVQQVVIHNGEDQADAAQELTTDAIKKIYDIGLGSYDVTVNVGPSYQTKRQESVATQLELLKVMPPQMAANTLDIVVGNMDIPQAKEFAERLKRMIPPQILGGDEGDPQVQLQRMKSTLDQAMQQHDLLTKALNEAKEVIQTKQVEQQGKTQIAQMQEQSKQAIVKMQEATKLAVAQINASKDLQQTFAESEIAQYDLLHSDAHELAMQNDQQAHQKELAQQAAANAQQSQQADQSHDMNMAAQQGATNGQ